MARPSHTVRKPSIIRINEAKIAPKDKKLRKQINGKINNIGSADENNKITAEISSSSARVSIQLKAILRGFSLSSCPQHSLKVLLL
jgi:hypothetical protein